MEKDSYLTRKEASTYLRCSKSWLDNLAWQGYGPRFYKQGNKVWYKRSDLDAWVAEGLMTPLKVA